MCLAIPAKLIEREGNRGRVETSGVITDVNLALLESAELGDYLIIHAGFALEKLDEEEALKRLELFREIAEKGMKYA